MKLNILFFSVLRDVTQTSSVEWECDGVTTVADALGLVFARWPALEAWDQSLLLAVDREYVKREAMLQNGAELAIMPPVQGG